MNTPLPLQVTAAALRQLAAPDERHAVRIMLMSTAGMTQYTLRGIRRRYVLERDAKSGRHVLDVPASLWNQEIPAERYHDNPSIPHDLMSKPNPLTPFITMIIPWGTPIPGESAGAEVIARPVPPVPPNVVDAVETIALRLLAQVFPDRFETLAGAEIHEALSRECGPTITEFLSRSGRAGVVEFITDLTGDTPADAQAPAAVQPAPPAPAKAETPAAKRMREKRARDKAAREQQAKLQPA